MTRDTQPVTKAAAATALRAAGFTINEGYENAGTTIVHTMRGSFGADWNLDSALAYVERAISIEWVPHLLHHDLKVRVPDDRAVYFDVPRPGRPA